MSVKKIFMTLIVIVACVMIGAFLLNTLLPNATNSVVDAAETAIYKATGFQFDLNRNGGATETDLTESSKAKVGKESIEGNHSTGWEQAPGE